MSAREEIGGAPFVYHADGAALVTGEGAYIADIALPGMVEVAFARSSIARGRISIDTEAASRMPGVLRVATGREIAASVPNRLPRASMVLHASEDAPETFNLPAYPLLPVDDVHFEGEAVAIVAAETRYLAEDAVEALEIDYQPLAPVLDPEASLAPGCDQLFEDVAGNLALEGRYGSTQEPGTVFDDAALVLRRRYRMNRSGNPPLETLGVIAHFENRRLTVWSTIQRPHILRIALADILGIPASRVRVIAPQNIGGGFGWKSPMHRETAAIAWLAMQLERPVRWIEDRTEALKKGIHERDQIWDMEAAFDAAGRLLALKSEVIADVGSVLVDMYGLVPSRISATLPFPYDIPWVRTHLRCAITNKAPMGLNRPAGRMPAVWAIERLMDDAARELKISPAQIRLDNFVRSFPYASPIAGALGGRLTDSDYAGTLGKLLDQWRYGERMEEAKRLRASGRWVGIGLAACVEICRPVCSIGGVLFYNQPQFAAVTLRMYPDGSLSIMSGDAPQGQMRHTTMAKVAAEELGIDPEVIEVHTGDTLLSPITNSNTDVASVCAVAARKLRARIIGIAAHLMRVPADEANFSCAHGVVTHSPDGRVLTYREIAWTTIMRPFLLPAGSTPDLMESAYVEAPYSPTSFAAHAAMVEVDPHLGKVRILSYGFVGDSGKKLNPRGLRTAIIAGIATGISNTTHEAYIYDEQGQLVTSNMKDYAMLTADEMPLELVIGHNDTPTAATIYGHKRMISEGVPTGVPPAMANAIIDAFGGAVDITTIPFSPGDLWATVNEAASAAKGRR
ncbi:MAG TPA: xanthine dehydrogenase family protein molybdopterin-binding subunit [Ramlibacter sp.]|uniref:xanthine dehydrogenase family protein molybdopterin-binding subunit n=1 Tax=Ramlibacter sp. TaxID=1917967 RepID=UPI002BE059A6|nr:xanthine dehydrogenase family protein molybdopterin-binding subunit [Ramlibacter sp.]HVZ42203.1 xanthine dehydrogenase family protein molybdopterin-binding subunit [Ramlibacter sp.]